MNKGFECVCCFKKLLMLVFLKGIYTVINSAESGTTSGSCGSGYGDEGS